MFFIMLAILLAIVVQNFFIGLAVSEIEMIWLNSVIEKTSIVVGMFGHLDCNHAQQAAPPVQATSSFPAQKSPCLARCGGSGDGQ